MTKKEPENSMALAIYRALSSFALLLCVIITIFVASKGLANVLGIDHFFLLPFDAAAIYLAGRLCKP